jgi:hypothetical protein
VEQGHDRAPRLRVELAGRLVGQQQLGPVGQGARDGHTLLLAAGHLVRAVPGTVPESDALQQFRHAPVPLATVRADEPQRHLDVFGGGEDGHQPEGLEDVGDGLAAQGDEVALAQPRDLAAVDADRARSWLVEPTQQVEQRRLAAAGAAAHGQHLAPADLQVDAAQRVHGVIAEGEVARDGHGQDHRAGGSVRRRRPGLRRPRAGHGCPSVGAAGVSPSVLWVR